MLSMSIVDYIHELKQAGFTDSQAEVQAKLLEQVVSEVKKELTEQFKQGLKDKDLATRGDSELRLQKEIEIVRKEIAETNNKQVRWIIGVGFISITTIVGALYTLLTMMMHS